MHTCCGTPHYVAPEILGSEQFGVEVDFWSLGVILYVMVSGYQPFNSKSVRTMYEMIAHGQYRFPKPQWEHVSPEAIECVKGLMTLEPKQRLNGDTLCKHPFITKNVDLKELEKLEEELLLQQQEMLRGSCSLLPTYSMVSGHDIAEKPDTDLSNENELMELEPAIRMKKPTKTSA